MLTKNTTLYSIQDNRQGIIYVFLNFLLSLYYVVSRWYRTSNLFFIFQFINLSIFCSIYVVHAEKSYHEKIWLCYGLHPVIFFMYP